MKVKAVSTENVFTVKTPGSDTVDWAKKEW